ncbi:MAG: hypothetical protein KAI17_17090 [Thiotrichaceae bacterium]|nr:hypothetical protein [Thiotrichaceae bacterium]
MTGLLFLSPLSFAANSVLIIKSGDNSFFNNTVEQLINQTRDQQVYFQVKNLGNLKPYDTLLKSSAVIITLGLDAANFLNDKNLKQPVIHSYLAAFQYLKHDKRDNHYGILLDQPLHRYLSFIKNLLGNKSIGIIKQQENKINQNILNKLSATLDLNLDQKLFKVGDNPVNIVRELLQKSDVLLSLPDPDIYNRQSLKGILLTSYRQNKPMISYSPAHVRSGALAAIFSSPESIGNQIAALLNKLLDDSQFIPAQYSYASEFDILINHRVARSLGIKMTDKKDILKRLKLEQIK